MARKRTDWPKGEPWTVKSWHDEMRRRERLCSQDAERAMREAARFRDAAEATLREDRVVEVSRL